MIELIDSAVPRMGRPSGVSPNSWAAKASCTVSEGSSSFMAISSRITPRSSSTSFGSMSELVTMFVIVIHHIHDRAGFQAAEAEAIVAGLPEGVAFPGHATSADHRLAISVCEGESVTAVRDVVEGAIGRFADSEYYEMNVVGIESRCRH